MRGVVWSGKKGLIGKRNTRRKALELRSEILAEDIGGIVLDVETKIVVRHRTEKAYRHGVVRNIVLVHFLDDLAVLIISVVDARTNVNIDRRAYEEVHIFGEGIAIMQVEGMAIEAENGAARHCAFGITRHRDVRTIEAKVIVTIEAVF